MSHVLRVGMDVGREYREAIIHPAREDRRLEASDGAIE